MAEHVANGSPMSGIEQAWADKHLDFQVLRGKVRSSSRSTQQELEKR
jgi:hypothetical protein